jgi:hypothetical protein
VAERAVEVEEDGFDSVGGGQILLQIFRMRDFYIHRGDCHARRNAAHSQ